LINLNSKFNINKMNSHINLNNFMQFGSNLSTPS